MTEHIVNRIIVPAVVCALVGVAAGCSTSSPRSTHQPPYPSGTPVPPSPSSSESMPVLERLTSYTAKTWQMVDFARPDSEETVADCLRDNQYIFSASGEFVNNDGEIPCTKDGVRELRGKWTFSNDSTRIIIRGTGMRMTVRVSELTDSLLVLQELSENGNVLSVSTFRAR